MSEPIHMESSQNETHVDSSIKGYQGQNYMLAQSNDAYSVNVICYSEDEVQYHDEDEDPCVAC